MWQCIMGPIQTGYPSRKGLPSNTMLIMVFTKVSLLAGILMHPQPDITKVYSL